MKPQALHLDDLPPLHVPFRFYLTAPLFGIAAAVLLLVDSPNCWMSRWTDTMLSAVHLLTLGVIAMVMLGSLFQVVVVLGGRAIPGVRWVPTVVHIAVASGVVFLCVSLRSPETELWAAALVCLGAGFAVFAVALGTTLLRRCAGRESMFAVRIAALAMIVTVGLGFFLAASRAWPGLYVAFRTWTNVHAAWGLAGWVALLVMGVSFQVIPMFQVAPAFHPRWAIGTAACLFGGLVAIGHARSPWLVAVLMTVISGALIAYGVHALSVLHRRTRRRVDALNASLRLSLGSLIVAALGAWILSVAGTRQWLGAHAATGELLLGVVAVAGFALSMALGMLLKITAFLMFVHLQRRCLRSLAAASHLPVMNEFVTDGASTLQFRLHALATVALSAAAIWPSAGSIAALILAADFGCLLWILTTALRRYHRADARIRAVLG